MSVVTMGSLIDRLTVLNLKLWHVQDKIYQAARGGEGLDAETVSRLASLNLDRNETMTAIDELFAQCLRTGVAPVDARVKIT